MTQAGYLLLKLRFDNFGTDGAGREQGCKYHFHVVNKLNPNEKGFDTDYSVFVRDSNATLHTHPETPQAHLDLIEAWARTNFSNFSVLESVPVAGGGLPDKEPDGENEGARAKN